MLPETTGRDGAGGGSKKLKWLEEPGDGLSVPRSGLGDITVWMASAEDGCGARGQFPGSNTEDAVLISACELGPERAGWMRRGTELRSACRSLP
jgi:hypothetical protein